MVNKFLKLLTKNVGLKLLSVGFAIVLWLLVVSVSDPQFTRNFTIDVAVTREDAIEDFGMVYDVIEGNVAQFSVTGKRSYVDKLSKTDFEAVADLSKVKLDPVVDINKHLVPIEIKVNKWETLLTVTNKTENMQISLEYRLNKNVRVSAVHRGTPKDGYAIGVIDVNVETVEVEGPESVVSKIDKAVIDVNIDGASRDITMNATPLFYDEYNEKISSDFLKVSPEQVEFTATILATKRVPINCSNHQGQPKDGYYLSKLESSPEFIIVKGDVSDLEHINEINIEEIINIEGASENVMHTIYDISSYLPQNVYLVDDESNSIVITAIIESLSAKDIEISTSDIIVEEQQENMKLEFGNSNITVTLRGMDDVLASITNHMIQAKINLNGLEPGQHLVDVEFMLPDNVTASKVQVEIILISELLEEEDKKEEEANNQNNGADDNENNKNETDENVTNTTEDE